jgi:DNA-binding response OmpR family regulator
MTEIIIFIVDDNVSSLTAAKSILKPYYTVFPIPSAAKMFDLLKHVKPALILLDVEMPDMNGYEAARRLKNDDVLKNIPLIFLSGRSDPESETEGLNLGALDFIQKPIESTLLINRLKTLLSGTDQSTTPP